MGGGGGSDSLLGVTVPSITVDGSLGLVVRAEWAGGRLKSYSYVPHGER